VTSVVPEGRKMLRIEARNAQTPIERKPPWIKVKATMGPEFTQLRGLVQREGLHTVCQEAGCPNIYECWEDREATFLIGATATAARTPTARSPTRDRAAALTPRKPTARKPDMSTGPTPHDCVIE
jgi:lipoate synthase